MSDPIEIIADAMNDSRDYGIPAAKYVATKLEAAGYRLLSAEGVTDKMLKMGNYILDSRNAFG